MIKKYSKLILVAICAFFICMTPSFAKEFTKAEFAEYLQKLEEEEGEYIDTFYLVGEYAFTNRMQFTIQDAMLAARSIKVNDTNGKINTDAIYGEMTIHLFKHTPDASGNYVVQFDRNPLGTTAEPTKLQIKYVDYKYIPEDSKAELSSATAAEIKTALGIDYENDTNLNVTDSKQGLVLTGDMFANDTIDENVLPKEDLTGYYYAFKVKVDDITDETVVTVFNKTLTKSDFNANGEAVVLVPLNPELDKEDRIIEVKVDVDGASNPVYGNTTYTIDYKNVVFKAELDLDNVVSEIMSDISTNKLIATLEDGTVTINQLDVTGSLSETTGKGLVDALKATLGTEGVKSVTLTYDGKEYVITEANVESQVASLLAAVAGEDYDKAIQNDVIGKSITMTVELKDGNITTVTPDGKTSVEYTIDFAGTKAKESEATVIVDATHAAYTDAVKTILENMKFNELDTNLKYENGKLTGTVLKNDNVGAEFSSLPEDITGYYFTYVLELKENPTEDTTVTIPGSGSTKVVTKADFDTENAIVIATALHSDSQNKVIQIVVDLDGDGTEYLPTTYTIDYSEVQFLDAEDYLKLASENTDEMSMYRSNLTSNMVDKAGEYYIIEYLLEADEATKTSHEVQKTTNNGGSNTHYAYSTVKSDLIYYYLSEDNVNWVVSKQAYNPSTGSMIDLFEGYTSVERIDSDIEGTIKLKVVVPTSDINLDDIVAPEDKEVFVPENDAEIFVYIKDDCLYRIDIDYLQVFGEVIQNSFTTIDFSVVIEKLTSSITIPTDVVNNAVEV